MEIEHELRHFRETKGTAAFVANELELLKGLKADRAFRDEGIEAGSLGGAEHTVTKGAAKRSRVERCGMRQAAGGDGDELDAEIRSLEHRLRHLRYRIQRVEAMLSALTQRERLVVQKFYIEGHPWSDVVALYKQEMPSPREADALKATRNAAMAKLQQIFLRCKFPA